jgi:hypothetical protein
MSAIRVLLALTIAAIPFSAHSQTNACQTFRGVCFLPVVGPVGAPCQCFPAYGPPDPGRLIFLGGPPPVQGPPPNIGDTGRAPISNACGTRFGVCQTMPAPIGSGCFCGRDPGQIIPFR